MDIVNAKGTYENVRMGEGLRPLAVLAREVSDELLNAAELRTVLDMLAVMETAEELKILEHLTPAQKRQVWDVTPQELKIKLHQLKERSPAPAVVLEVTRSPNAVTPTVALPPTAVLDTARLSGIMTPTATPPLDSSTLEAGIWVVLKAKPGLSKAELMAIFEVVEVQDEIVHCKAKGLGSRRYPIDWLMLYPRSPSGCHSPEPQ